MERGSALAAMVAWGPRVRHRGGAGRAWKAVGRQLSDGLRRPSATPRQLRLEGAVCQGRMSGDGVVGTPWSTAA